MKLKNRIIVALLALALAFTAVTTIAVVDDDTTITAEAASKIKLSNSSKTIGYKQSFNLSIKNTGSKTVKWSTSNKKVAKITKVSKTKYKVTGVKPGTATIKAKVGGKTYKCKVTVSKLCHTTQNLALGAYHTLGFKGANGKTVKWSTTDTAGIVAMQKVSNTKCKIMGLAPGTATIKAKVGNKTYKCKVTVTNPKLSKTSKKLGVGDSFNLSIKDNKGTPTWSTSDKSVASIKKVSSTKYKVTGKKKGTATIKVKVDGKTYKCKVTVHKHDWQTTYTEEWVFIEETPYREYYKCRVCGLTSEEYGDYSIDGEDFIMGHCAVEGSNYELVMEQATGHYEKQKTATGSKCSICGKTK